MLESNSFIQEKNLWLSQCLDMFRNVFTTRAVFTPLTCSLSFSFFVHCIHFVSFFVHCIHFPFISMMSCHVVSLISKAFLLFRDTFDDRSVVTSYFLFVLAWLLTSYIKSWFIKLLIILHTGFKSWVVINFNVLSKFYISSFLVRILQFFLEN